MNNENIIKKSKEYVKKRLDSDTSGHDFSHTERVYNNALYIAKRTTSDVDYLTVQLGALFHDVADHKFGYSDEDRKNIITNVLAELEIPDNIINEVIYIANNISFKNGSNKHELLTLEAKIVQDADRLDAIGAIGIARTFAFGSTYNRDMYIPKSNDVDLDPKDKEDTISHFYAKLLKVKDLMNTDIGKVEAEKRHEIMLEFLDNFYEEWNLGI